MSFFNGPIKIPKGSGVNVENTNGDVMTIKANQSAFSGGNYTLYFPTSYGTPDQVLKTDGAGNLSWSTVSGGSSTVSASNITTGSSNVNIGTTSGYVRVNAFTGESVQLQVTNSNIGIFSASTVTLTKPTTVSDATQSTSASTGALIVSGGAGIASNVNVGGNLNVTNNTVLSSNLTVSGTTQSTSASTGALIVTGGAGIAKDAYVGGNVVISGNLTVNGTTTTINSNITTIDDPVIELGTAGVADSFDRGIIGVYNTRKIFFGWDNSANVFTFLPDATVSDGSNVVSGSAGKAIFGEIVTDSNISINSTTQSTSASTGALIVSGGAGIASNVNVGGNLNVTNNTVLSSNLTVSGTTQSSSATTGALIVSGGVGIAKNTYIGGNLSVAGQVLYNVDSITSTSIVSTNATTLWSDTLNASIKHLLPPTNATQFYHSNTSLTYNAGQHMDIFFTRPAANTSATANIDFGSSNLYSGSGTAQYLVFTQPGQSASLIYLGGDDSVKGWRIINTGAQVY
jgi:enhancing lycopene biosynthesis protein 2